MAQPPASVRYRQVAIGQPAMTITQGDDAAIYLRPDEPLQPAPQHLLERLLHWAERTPQATLAAERDASGQWRRISYAQMLADVRAIAQALLAYGLGPERPLVILSGNDLEHLQLAFAAMYAGIPYCPVSPAYSLLSQDLAKLRHIFQVLGPGLIFAAEANAFERAILAVADPRTPLVFTRGALAQRPCIAFDSLLQQNDCSEADQAFAATGAQTIAKFLFTSGSTKLPKAVPTTQGMLCANQQMLLQTFPEFAIEPPVLVDWLPWNHTFGGSHNVGIALYNGGSLYIDGGKPTPQGMAETVRNLIDVSPTVYLTVPKGWEELVGELERNVELRERFFARIKLLFFAGAGLSQAVWDRLDAVAEAHCGERIRMMAGLGMTEASPSCTFTTGPLSMAGYVGLPAPGCEIKLVPTAGKLEARFRGPHIMSGYWRAPQLSAEAFDDEGYYRSGDALRFADPHQPQLGLMFDGRIAEDFKLSTGVFVSVGPLRTRVILQGAPYVQDVVVTGPDRQRIGLLVFPNLPACRALAGLGANASIEQVLAAEPVRRRFELLLEDLNREATGLASHIAWACLMSEAPSLDAGEITDKGSLNQSAVLSRRAALIDSLYADPAAHCVVAKAWP
ncbi:feruloyl-CoA synthase [Pseudomonas entomophila]|uniref:feruloyl-CoA synthase n=1 Tax=Pseudomonas entomophila TaxID=312306 RepID=UPI0023D8612E|nr:feruloyl-CoA synthase [Pseudomonas entomophila]MDF0729502.1 feruloyl-CoA synthase [Pseudomonas entomophila]